MKPGEPKVDEFTLERIRKEALARLKPQAQSHPHKVPEVFRHVIKVDWFREFTLKERLAILFGANLRVFIRIPTRHNPAALQPVIMAELSKYPDAQSEMAAQLENLMIDQEQDTKQTPHP